MSVYPTAKKQRRIRFVDDATRDKDEAEKDTRLKYKAPPGTMPPVPSKSSLPPGVSALQAKMLALAGQEVPTPTHATDKDETEAEATSRSLGVADGGDAPVDDEDGLVVFSVFMLFVTVLLTNTI